MRPPSSPPFAPASTERVSRYRWSIGAVMFAGWSLMALLGGIAGALAMQRRGQPIAWYIIGANNLSFWWLWALLSLPATRLARHFRLDRPGWLRVLPVHFVAALLFAWGHLALSGVAYYLLVGRAQGAAFGSQLRSRAESQMLFEMMIYGCIVGVYYAMDLYDRFRKEQLAAAELEARTAVLESHMTQARLDALRMHLNPHFLFNTRRADRMRRGSW